MQSLFRLLARGLVAGLLLSVFAACSPKPPAAAPLPILGAGPAWSLTDLDGKPIGSEQLKGKVVLVEFWATWCAPCVHDIPFYVELHKRYADRGLAIVGLSLDEKAEEVVRPFAKRMNIGYPLALATPEVMTAFGEIEAIPTMFLIDREGRIRHRQFGAMELDELDKLVASLL